jgi:hypothetical protein
MNPTAIDFSKAGLVVDEYVKAMTNPDPRAMPKQISSRSWIEFCLERNGVIKDVRALKLGQSHALWYACLILTKRVREVSRLEKRLLFIRPGGTTENTIKRLLDGDLRSNIGSQLLKDFLAQAGTVTTKNQPRATEKPA